ncbi:MAG: zinc ribbon domain-containing protein [Leptospirales bacterium]
MLDSRPSKNKKTGPWKALLYTKDGSSVSLSKFVILFLTDLLLVFVLISGFVQQSSFVTSPTHEIPEQCRQMLSEPAPEPENRLGRIANLVSATEIYKTEYEVFTDKKLSEICKPAVAKLVAVQANEDLKAQVDTWLAVKDKLYLVEAEVAQVESSYETILIAEKAKTNPIKLTAEQKDVKNIYHSRMKLRNILMIQLRSIELDVERYSETKDLYKIIQMNVASRDSFLESIDSAELSYPFRKIASQLMFAFPLFFFSFIGLALGRKKGTTFFELFCYHILLSLIFVVAIFAVYSLIQPLLVAGLEIARNALIVNGLSFLWSYTIFAALVLIAIVIERIISGSLWRKSVLLPSLVKTGRCTMCELKVPDDVAYCPHCGEKLLEKCVHCGHSIHHKSDYCSDCGKPQE